MAELCLMTSNSYLPLPGLVIYPEQSITKVSKDYQHILPFHGSNRDLAKLGSFDLNLHQKVEWKPTNGVLQHNQFVKNSSDKRPVLIDVQDTTTNTILFSIGIAEQCIRRERIMKLLASASTEIESSLLDLSMLYDLWGPQPPITDLPQQTFAAYSRWFFSDDEPQQSLIYPTQELYFKKPKVDFVGDLVVGGELSLNGTGIKFKDILSVIDELHLLKNYSKSSKQTMLVPYFERRRRGASANANRENLKTVKIAPVKSPEKVKDRTLQKKKTSKKSSKERDLYSNSYLHACESLLSIMVDRKQQGRSAILSLKKSGPELPQLLTQISASIAGTGIAVLLSVICKVACGRVPFCASKVLTTGVGFGLVWLSWAVNKLRYTVTSISKNSGKLGMKEEEIMDNLDRNLKDVYFGAAALLAFAMLKAGMI
ncbi:unnamed protein product [Fraxinus pennsylvanica]|uniref:Uncharacterized protein n=1 Tax=Fraxinus pennsylvanica TaxID=56036 RepID=A0AAD2EEX7_9LAMI|nr:unnamed protein product [Fraxinus pennsylvanica]